MYNTIKVEKKDGVATITLNRPERLNAVNKALEREVLDAIADIRDDDSVSVVILTGAGRAFCSGRDLKDAAEGSPLSIPSAPGGVWKALEDMEKPVIAAVNGACYTAGLNIAECCDIILASEAATFCDTHVRYGAVGGGGAVARLARVVGLHKAKEIMFTCEPFSAQEAERIGLVNRVVPADKLMEAAHDMAQKILRYNRLNIQTQKRIFNQGFRVGLLESFEIEHRESEAFLRKRPAREAEERLRAFATKKEQS